MLLAGSVTLCNGKKTRIELSKSYWVLPLGFMSTAGLLCSQRSSRLQHRFATAYCTYRRLLAIVFGSERTTVSSTKYGVKPILSACKCLRRLDMDDYSGSSALKIRKMRPPARTVQRIWAQISSRGSVGDVLFIRTFLSFRAGETAP